ncbi:ABC transporter ATP-binding protein [bacterium]|nr:ABC transporter ATP-binding protein [bacterium]
MKLEIQSLSKTYSNGVRALKGIDMVFSNGMFGLLGPNGAGKSTLMRIIATLQVPDQGCIIIDGKDIKQSRQDVRKILGYLPQSFGVYPDVSAEEMLNHIILLKGIRNKRKRNILVEALLEQTNLIDVRKRKLGGFSGGMKQRFGIAQALAGNPELLIVDEPTAGLDPEERNRFHNILSEISEDRIVILSTHIVDDVRQLCDQMAILHEGEILYYGRTVDAIDNVNGKIWQKIINKDEIADYHEQHEIVLSRLYAGKICIHVYHSTQPEGFEPVEADLEDMYFKTIKKIV